MAADKPDQPTHEPFEYVLDNVVGDAAFGQINKLVHAVSGVNLTYHTFDRRYLIPPNEKCSFGFNGSIAKRIASFLFKHWQIKLPDPTLEQIGQIAKRSVTEDDPVRLLFDFTNKITWERGEFGDSDSCYWTINTVSKEFLEGDEGFSAMRFWTHLADNTYKGTARCWAVNRQYSGQWCVALFNAYGTVTLIQAARVLSDWLGLTYSPVNRMVNSEASGAFYTNGSSGQLVHPPGLDPPKEIDLHISCRIEVPCDMCRVKVDQNKRYTFGILKLCRACFAKQPRCGRCDAVRPLGVQFNGKDICAPCKEQLKTCDRCQQTVEPPRRQVTAAAGTNLGHWCTNCVTNYTTYCVSCDARRPKEEVNNGQCTRHPQPTEQRPAPAMRAAELPDLQASGYATAADARYFQRYFQMRDNRGRFRPAVLFDNPGDNPGDEEV